MAGLIDDLYRSIAEGLRRAGALQAALLVDGGRSQGPAWQRTAASFGLTPDLKPLPETCTSSGGSGPEPTPGVEDSGGLLASASRFSFGRFADPLAQIGDWIDVEAVPGPSGVQWSVTCGKWAYTHSGTWVLEASGQDREHAQARGTRWADRDKAVAVARRLIADGHPDTKAWKTGREIK